MRCPSARPNVRAEAWLAEHWHLLLAATSRILRCPEDAEDAANDAAYKVWRGWPRFDAAKGTRETWAATIARRVAIDHWRRIRGTRMLPLLEEGRRADGIVGIGSVDVETMACVRADERARVTRVWPLLTERERSYAVRLASGWTYDSLARDVRVPTSTIKTRVRVMRERVRPLGT